MMFSNEQSQTQVLSFLLTVFNYSKNNNNDNTVIHKGLAASPKEFCGTKVSMEMELIVLYSTLAFMCYTVNYLSIYLQL